MIEQLGVQLDNRGNVATDPNYMSSVPGVFAAGDMRRVRAKRFKDQTQSPGTEAALRRDIEELRLGEPKYELMSAGLANVTRQQLPQLKATITQLGAVQSVTFKGVGPAGADIYEVKFEHGSTEWRLMLDADGKVETVGFRPL
jgi:hypothetical protein